MLLTGVPLKANWATSVIQSLCSVMSKIPSLSSSKSITSLIPSLSESVHAFIVFDNAKLQVYLPLNSPLPAVVSRPSANPLVPQGVTAIAFGLVVVVVRPLTLLATLPESKLPVTPASIASVQPSPSESKSKLLGTPSLSVSQATTCCTLISSIRKSSPVLLFPKEFV